MRHLGGCFPQLKPVKNQGKPQFQPLRGKLTSIRAIFRQRFSKKCKIVIA